MMFTIVTAFHHICIIIICLDASLSRLLTIEIDVFFLFFPQWSFLMKAITENQLHNLLINSRHFFQEILLTQFHIMRNHRRPSDKIWAQDGRSFPQTVVINMPS